MRKLIPGVIAAAWLMVPASALAVDYTPTNLTAAAGTRGVINLNWDDSPDPNFKYFAVRRSTDPLLDKAQWTRLAPNYTTSQATDTGLADNTTYYYYATEISTTGVVSGRSNVASATTVPAGTVYFNSDFDAHPTDATFNYRASGGGLQGWGAYTVVDDPDSVVEPGSSSVRKVVKTDTDYSDFGDSTCPRRSRIAFMVGHNLPVNLTFGSSYYYGGSFRLPADFPTQFPPDNGGGLAWVFNGGGDTFSSPFAGSSASNTPKLSIQPGARVGLPGDLNAYLTGPGTFRTTLTRGRWIDYVIWHHASSGVNVADGAVRIWTNTGAGWQLVYDVSNVVTINSAMSDGKLVHYAPKTYYPSTLTAPAGWTDFCSTSGKTYFAQDPNGTYGWRNRVVTSWTANFKLGNTFDVVKPRTYE